MGNSHVVSKRNTKTVEKRQIMLQLAQCKLPYKEATKENLIKKIAHTLRVSVDDIQQMNIVKRSIDARKKPQIILSYTIHFSLKNEDKIWNRNQKVKGLSKVKKLPSLWDSISPVNSEEKILVVGSGPAGLFCAYYLALCGLHPIVIERGAPMEERVQDVEKFWKSQVLDEDSNVSFGEGGAGTFSDGKLNTGVKDRTGRKQFILESFVRFGADESICYDAHPHIGTDVLRRVIVAMREEMKELGSTFFFHTVLADIQKKEHGLHHAIVSCEGKERIIPCHRLVLAIGHSARDTFSMLYKKGVEMTQKPFAVGVRVEHLQKDIDYAQYGFLDDLLPAAPYKLTGKTSQGRGVYSFCMCPGGYVVNASSERDALVVNGMSDSGRNSGYANSAIVVQVFPEDFRDSHPLAGVLFQREYEKKMYAICRGKIPIQTYGDFVRNRKSTSLGKVAPCVKGTWGLANLRQALPNFVVDGIIEGMGQFGKKIQGFDAADTLLLGFEARTSSPVRIERNEEFESVVWSGVYPCGEGAGYAGGIMSAAMDGLRVAMKIQEKLMR